MLLLPFDAVYVVPYCVAIAAEHYKVQMLSVIGSSGRLNKLMNL